MRSKLFNNIEEYKASAPGSLMLIGEHAVLTGSVALVCAMNRRIFARLRPRDDQKIHLVSDTSGELMLNLIDIKPNLLEKKPEWRFVLAAILGEQKSIKTGFELKIESEQKDPIGLGSSAAVSVITTALLWFWLKKDWIGDSEKDKSLLCKKVIALIRKVQGKASGADVAASVFGGVLSYEMRPLKIEKLALSLPLVVVYSGQKIPTKKVLEAVSVHARRSPQIFANLYKTMTAVGLKAKFALKSGDIIVFGELMNVYHGLLDALGVNNSTLSEIVYALRDSQDIYGAKISGAGMGDCVIGLGESNIAFPQNEEQEKLGVRSITTQVDSEGILFY